MSSTDFNTDKSDKNAKLSRQGTYKERSPGGGGANLGGKDIENAYDTTNSLLMISHKQDVIEPKQMTSSKVMTVDKGVELIEKGKVTKGEDYAEEGRIKLEDYRKMHDPRA